MSRDMKPRQSSARPRSRGGVILGIFLGLLLGALVAAGVAWYFAKMPLPFQIHGKTEGKTEAAPEAKAEEPARKEARVIPENKPVPSQPIALPGKPGDKVDDRPRFEFYKILPSAGNETAKAGGDKPAEKTPEKPASEPVYLQVGAFSKAEDADTLRAKLALMGMEASVYPVTLPDKGTFHRVRLGPFARAEDASGVRNQLSQAGIQATVVKTKD